jgi:hypothetical protein
MFLRVLRTGADNAPVFFFASNVFIAGPRPAYLTCGDQVSIRFLHGARALQFADDQFGQR